MVKKDRGRSLIRTDRPMLDGPAGVCSKERFMPVGRVLLMVILLALFGATVSAQQAPEPQGKFVVVNGHRLWYRIAGQGSPLLIIPGGPGVSHTYLYPGLERLADSFQVIYFDAFGRGQSDRAQNPNEYSFNHDIDEVEGLRKALGLDKIAVYGHSYGGLVAQGYALRYPQSFSKLILANTLHSAEMWQKGNNDNCNNEIQNQFPEVWAELQQLRAKGGVSCESTYQKVFGRVPPSLLYFYDPSHANVVQDLNLEVYCRIAGPDADIVLGGDLASVDFRQQLSEIRIPTLVLAGRFDRVAIPRYSVQYRTLMPQAEFVMFEQSGHQPFIEEPELHDSVVRAFLSK
jgi:proline iminopeptidase